VSRDERPLAAVPGAVWVVLALSLAGQIAWQAMRAPDAAAAAELPAPPRPEALHLASFGEPEATARVAMLYVQAFDLRVDYRRLVGWLESILELDPRSQYPLFSAARIYAEAPDPARSRTALEFVYREFFRDPERRWPWLAHAALVAKHRLGDLPLARRYAQAIDRHTRSPGVPLWARQMEIFILEDMNELEAARIVLGGLLESGAVHDPAEARFLRQRLEELEARASQKR
jgi:TPR repeat protein